MQVLPVDVLRSEWTLGARSRPNARRCGRCAWASTDCWAFSKKPPSAWCAARAQGPFDSIEDLARRARLDARALQLLSQADALRPLAGHRHQAAWGTAGIDTRATVMLASTRTHEAQAAVEAPTAGEELLADYRSTGLSLTHHPLALLRERTGGVSGAAGGRAQRLSATGSWRAPAAWSRTASARKPPRA